MRDEEGLGTAVEILKLLEARVERLNRLCAKEKRIPEEFDEILNIFREFEDDLKYQVWLAEMFLKREIENLKRQPPDPKIEIVTEKDRRIFETVRESQKKIERLRRER